MSDNSIVNRSWEDYYIPGTTVLRNKFVTPDMPYGVTDQNTLTALEEIATNLRFQDLMENPIEGNFDYAHMKAIHYHIFQDVYDWAGQERTAPTSTGSIGFYHSKNKLFLRKNRKQVSH